MTMEGVMYMNKNSTSSFLADVTFEEIMSEEVISSGETKRSNGCDSRLEWA